MHSTTVRVNGASVERPKLFWPTTTRSSGLKLMSTGLGVPRRMPVKRSMARPVPGGRPTMTNFRAEY